MPGPPNQDFGSDVGERPRHEGGHYARPRREQSLFDGIADKKNPAERNAHPAKPDHPACASRTIRLGPRRALLANDTPDARVPTRRGIKRRRGSSATGLTGRNETLFLLTRRFAAILGRRPKPQPSKLRLHCRQGLRQGPQPDQRKDRDSEGYPRNHRSRSPVKLDGSRSPRSAARLARLVRDSSAEGATRLCRPDGPRRMGLPCQRSHWITGRPPDGCKPRQARAPARLRHSAWGGSLALGSSGPPAISSPLR